MSILDNFVFEGFLLVLAGVMLALQSGFNGTLGRLGGGAFAALVSFSLGTIICIIYFLIEVFAFKSTPNLLNLGKTAPWWAWLGGICGGYYVIVNILTVPRLGAGTVLSIFVCSQIIFACIMDHFALAGVPQRDFTIWRGLGVIALIGGVVVITKF